MDKGNKLIGDNIKRARKRKGLTQKDLAELLGLTVVTIQRYESGYNSPRASYVPIINTALGTDIYSKEAPTETVKPSTPTNMYFSLNEFSVCTDALLLSGHVYKWIPKTNKYRLVDGKGNITEITEVQLAELFTGILQTARQVTDMLFRAQVRKQSLTDSNTNKVIPAF